MKMPGLMCQFCSKGSCPEPFTAAPSPSQHAYQYYQDNAGRSRAQTQLSPAGVLYYQYYQDNAGRSRAQTQLSPAKSSTTSTTRIMPGEAGRKPN